jgi:thiol-disulfide isomerase/thioredoxin
MKPATRFGIGTALALSLCAPLRSAPPQPDAETPPAAELPRYKLEVGQELVYASSSDFKHQSGGHESTERTTLWVTRKNDDGSWHVVGHSENGFTQRFEGKFNIPPRVEARRSLGEFDVRPDGTVVIASNDSRVRSLSAMFFKLPSSQEELESGWSVERDGGTEKMLFRAAKDNDGKTGKWIFERADTGLFSVIYVSTSESQIHFDGERGLVTKMDSQRTQNYGFNGKGTGSLELKSSGMRDAKWISQLAREVARYSQVMKEYMDNRESGKDPEERHAAAANALREAREKVELPMVITQIEEQQKQLEKSKQYMLKDIEREKLVLGKIAADWNTKDIDGASHSMEGYRGKVVVMDFWYRGCGWCIKAMPQIKELVEHYRDKPVVVLGMNTDREETDARFVVDKLGLNYATLKATGLPEKFAVQGFPTLVIVDQHGIVRKRHVGYSPTLRDDLIEEIDLLLKSGD